MIKSNTLVQQWVADLRFEPGTAANRAVFKQQGLADWPRLSGMDSSLLMMS